MTKPTLRLIPSAILIFGGLTFGASAASPVEIDGDDIGGVVQSRVGPEAGVWVIAETSDLGTRFAKIVVTDEQGRYVIPICQRPNIDSGCAAMGSSTRPRSTQRLARSMISSPSTRPVLRQPHNIILRSIGCRCSRFPDEKNFLARATPAVACRRLSSRRSNGSIS